MSEAHRTRADAHREAFAKAWSDFIEEDEAYSSVVDIDDDGTGTIRVLPISGLPDILAIELGEMLYQFRTALDGCIYQAAILETGQNPRQPWGRYRAATR